MVIQIGRRIILFMLVTGLLFAAGLTSSSGEAQEPAAQPPAQYVLGPNDQLRVQVFGEDDLSGETRIDGQGNIQLPLVGSLPAAGKTIGELQRVLTERLASGYVRNPQVTVRVLKHRNLFVSGEVKSPGGYPFEEGLTVGKVVTLGGGLTEKADRHNIVIKRKANGREETIPANLESPVLPDDTVVVAEGQKFFVSGEVKTPGRYLYEKGLTVHKALSLAGGRTEKGDKGPVKVTRVMNGVAETLTAGADAAVQPDDILVVEQEHRRVYVSGEVKTPGGYPYQEGVTVHRVLAMAGGLTEKAERGLLQILRRVEGREDTVAVQLDSLVLPDDIVVVAEGQKFFVSGEVKTPGRYLYEKGLTVHKALSLAGGRTDKAERGTIVITRLVDGVPRQLEVSDDALLEPGDFVLIPTLKKVYVDGEVKRAGDYPYERNLTVHKAITMAGGVTDKASIGSAKILRKMNGREESLPATLDGPLLPEDIIVVPRSFF